MLIFETQTFEFTGTNICIGFFKRKNNAKEEELRFMGTKIKKHSDILNKEYTLKPEYKYRAGSEFEEFLNAYYTVCPLKVDYYLLKIEVLNNKGDNLIPIIDANNYKNNHYKRDYIKVNDYLKQKIESNKLYVRTVDTGSRNGRVGLSLIEKDFDVKGVYVSGNTYRTHPIQIFLEPVLKEEDQILLKDYFNFILEFFRKELDSEFLTTYKYSSAEYTRKYLGLTQVRKLIETFPILNMDDLSKSKIKESVEKKDVKIILTILNNIKKGE
jgi:hypothetical protein